MEKFPINGGSKNNRYVWLAGGKMLVVHDSSLGMVNTMTYQKIILSIWDWIGCQNGQRPYALVGPSRYVNSYPYPEPIWQFQCISKNILIKSKTLFFGLHQYPRCWVRWNSSELFMFLIQPWIKPGLRSVMLIHPSTPFRWSHNCWSTVPIFGL